MIFRFKMKMKGRHGAPISFMIGDADVKSIDELSNLLNDDRFLVIEQKRESRDGELSNVGPIVVNRRSIITAREYRVKETEESHND